jgi:tRNA (uracil-5-)-methyltransferase
MRQTTRAWRREYKNMITLATECADPSQPDKPSLFCPLEPIVGSAVTTAYRNKSEFSVGYNAEMKPAVGFLMGKFIEGTVTVESIAEVPHVPDIAKALVACLGSFVSASAGDGLLPYNKHGHSGFWRMLSVRNSAATRQCMCLVQVDPKERTAEQMDAFRAQLLQHFRTTIIDNEEWAAANGGYRLVALQLQLYSGVSNAAPEGTPIELLHGAEACIHESLMGLDFRVSQSAFFQINVAQTEVLYNIAARFAALPAVDAPPSVKAQHVLLDVCCGTGTIGQSLANRVGKVIGLEMSGAAVEDAKANAKANQISNAFYYTGKAEETLSLALAEHVATLPAADSSVSVTAIVDPPRSGLHADVIRLLRRCPRIQRVVYVSCNPRSLMDNLQRFLQPTSKTYQGPPFTAVKAVPVDMFPM